MKYCVRIGTAKELESSEFNTDEIFLQNAQNAGFTENEVEILTEEEYLTRKELEPLPIVEPTEFEELSNYILDVDFRVVMLEMGL